MIDLRSPSVPPVCARCVDHSTDAGSRNVGHAAMYQRVLDDAQDELSLARGERDFYRERSVQASKRADTLITVLTAVHDQHHDRGGRCCCGETTCAVYKLLVEPPVARLLGTYDEQQHTMVQLHQANPGAFAPEWDYVDVTLVYPARIRRTSGRHRAAG